MTKVTLRAYNHEIESMIEQGQRLDEAVAHCRHILVTYPKHLSTYRLLGKAYLEGKRYDQAVDIFQRVLVAAPDDFVSHVGMSIIADDQGKLDESIWHMERAFEVQPSNAAIQSELQRLFGRRDGMEPPKIRLTRGALAQMYVQGDLYSQAISEIRAVLANDPDRMDMQVLLAKAYARNGQKAEAADTCSALLAVSPYCVDANRLMAEILPGTQSSAAADEIRRRVVELDPYAEHAGASLFDADAVADGLVTLPRLDYMGPAADTPDAPGLGLAPSKRTAEQAAAVPGWLSSGSPSTSADAPLASPIGDLPEFLRGSGWREVPENSEQGSSASYAAVEPTAELEDEALPGALPDWVRSLAPADADASNSFAPDFGETKGAGGAWQPVAPSAEQQLDQSGDGAKDATPDWLRELAGGDGALSGTDSTGRADSPPLVPSAESTSGGVANSDDGLAWLEGLGEKHGAKPEELMTSPEQRAADAPDWIAKLRQDDSISQESWQANAEERPGADFSTSNLPLAEEPFTPKPASSMDWLSDLAEPDAFAAMERSGESEQGSFSSTSASSTRRTPVSDDTLPDWLADKPAKTSSPVGEDQVAQPTPAESLPGWLADLDVKPTAAASEGAAPPPPQRVRAAEEPRESTSGGSQRRFAEVELGPSEVPSSTWSEPDQEQPEAATPGPVRSSAAIEDAPSIRARPAAVVPPLDATSLVGAKSELARGNIGAAMEMYGRLIRRGRGLAEIIRELREALYRFPVEVPIWQALGDAYMRANSLQEALDAYTKAEELLR